MDLPIQDENWTQNLRALGEYRKEMWDGNNEPCGIWQWYYDEEQTRKKAELVFDDDHPVYMTCWYESGKIKACGWYKDGFPRGETWLEEESGWDPLVVGYIAFAIAYTVTTLVNWLA
jgi:antitoxin component YwqK of YwqJK toxin-antitoxin module